jgi:hypothetical protein
MSERCSYCGRRGHWRPDCPEIAALALAVRRRRVDFELVSTPVVARTRKLKARWREEKSQDILAFHSLDSEVEIEALTRAINTMKQVRVDKAKLLAILKKNREDHRGIFLAAQKQFRVVAIKALDAQLKAARTGRPFELGRLTALSAPEDHTADYDRSIQMLEMSVDKEILVDEREFQNYVQDIWNWSRDWAVSNMRYVSKNTRGYGKLAALANDA